MSVVSTRARSLARIAAVQTEMVKLAEWKLGAARRRSAGLEEQRQSLATLVASGDPLGPALSRAASRSAAALGGRIADVEAEIEALERDLRALRCREKAVAGLSHAAEAAARHADEAASLAATMEAWLARASLP